jgi:FMN hydrolase / 5-amino-6-(5-phospho-D-ribitylamino)uracil phosphatase
MSSLQQSVRPTASSALPSAGQIDAISLDLDDTLWPVIPALVEAEREMHRWLVEHAPATGRLCSLERLKELRVLVAMANADRAHELGWLRLESLRQALREGGDDPSLAVGAFNVFMEGRQRVTLYAEVEPILQRWKSRYKLLVVTNGNADVSRIGIAQYFDAIAAAHVIGIGKPDRRIFEHACAEAGVEPSRVLHIGDDLELDVVGARGAGMHAAWLRRPDLDPDPHSDSRRAARLAKEAGGAKEAGASSAESAVGPSGRPQAAASEHPQAAPSEPFYRDLEDIDRHLTTG